jgi:hypothetical protein
MLPLPAPWAFEAITSGQPRDVLEIPHEHGSILLKRTGTTKPLTEQGTRGLASVATGTTILAALWPDDHVICDVRDFQATVALLALAGSPILRPGEGRSLQGPDWVEYESWFKKLIRFEVERRAVTRLELERALFVGYAYKPADSVEGRSWAEWGAELQENWKAAVRNASQTGNES